MKGRLYGVGVGPGDPELLTVKALRLIQTLPVLAYPAPETGESFARKIVARWLSPAHREIALPFPMRPGPPAEAVYERAAERLAAELDRGFDVACLCQGDPLFYGTFAHLLPRLAGRYEVEIVPGVSSLGAAFAAAALSLATGEETLLVIPATLAEKALEARLAAADGAVILKLGRHLAKVRHVLSRLSRLERAIYVERASLVEARVMPLAELGGDEAPYFSLALVPRGRTD